MTDTKATTADLYGDLDAVVAAPQPSPSHTLPPALSPSLAAENAALKARVAELETEARVWAAQRAVLVGNLGALLRTAKAVDARREREIRELRELGAARREGD